MKWAQQKEPATPLPVRGTQTGTTAGSQHPRNGDTSTHSIRSRHRVVKAGSLTLAASDVRAAIVAAQAGKACHLDREILDRLGLAGDPEAQAAWLAEYDESHRRLATHCVDCGAPLSAHRSKKNGYGRRCAEQNGWPY